MKKYHTAIMAITVAILTVIAGLVVVLAVRKPGSTTMYKATGDNTNKTVTMLVRDGKIIEPQGDITVKKDAQVHIRITDTKDTEDVDIKIPEFGQSTTFSQNSVGELDFVATKIGKFDIYFQPEDDARYVVAHLVVK